jgi:hypothetical protein
MSIRPNLPEAGTVLGTIKTEPLRGGQPARLDSPCARRLWVSAWPGRGKARFNRTRKWMKDMPMPA